MNVRNELSQLFSRVPVSKQGPTPRIGAPDLLIDSFEPSPPFPRSGDRIFLDVGVRNNGNAAATSFQVSVDGDSPLPFSHKAVPILEPQSFTRLRFGPFTARGGGNFRFEARADSESEVAESDERNNWSQTWFSVKDPWAPTSTTANL